MRGVGGSGGGDDGGDVSAGSCDSSGSDGNCRCCESGVGGSVNISRGNASDGNGYGGERYERTVDVMIGGEKEGGDG